MRVETAAQNATAASSELQALLEGPAFQQELRTTESGYHSAVVTLTSLTRQHHDDPCAGVTCASGPCGEGPAICANGECLSAFRADGSACSTGGQSSTCFAGLCAGRGPALCSQHR